MKGNRIRNSNWYERENEEPRYFKTNHHLHFDDTVIDQHRVATLSFKTRDYERLVYTETIESHEAKKVTVGLIIRGNDLDEINYKVAFYNKDDSCIDVYSHNVVAEVTPHFKRVCVTYPIIRGNDLDEINYKVAFYNKDDSCIDVYSHNVVAEVTPHFKRVCVTYPIPNETCYMKVGWEFKGINTGVTIFHPSVHLID